MADGLLLVGQHIEGQGQRMHQRIDGSVAPTSELHGLAAARDVQRQQFAVGAVLRRHQVVVAVVEFAPVLRRNIRPRTGARSAAAVTSLPLESVTAWTTGLNSICSRRGSDRPYSRSSR